MTSGTARHVEPGRTGPDERPRRAVIVDHEGLWTKSMGILPSFGGSVRWSRSTTAVLPGEAELVLILTRGLVAPGISAQQDAASITVLVDAPVALGHHGCGAVLACTHATMHEAVAAAAGALFTVAFANHVTGYQWDELLDVLSRDTLLVAAKAERADEDSIAVCAVRSLGYFQGRSRIEPEAVVLGIAVPRVRAPRLTVMGRISSSLRALTGHSCQQMTGYQLTSGTHEAVFLLAALPIPALPGAPVRALRRWPR